MIIYIWLNLNNISGRACNYERDSAICFWVSLRRGEEIYFPFRENVPKSSSVSKTRANYSRKNSGRMPPQEFRHRGHTIKLDVSTWPVYSRFVMTAIISSLSWATRNYAHLPYLVRAIIKFHLKIIIKLIFIKLSSVRRLRWWINDHYPIGQRWQKELLKFMSIKITKKSPLLPKFTSKLSF